MRDGNSEDSPLMGRFCGKRDQVPSFILTTQHHLRIRWESRHYLAMTFFQDSKVLFCRFHSDYHGNGVGFQLKYDFENATRWSCGGNYSNQSGILTSPLYPNPYPTADCVYLISQPNGKYINISFLTLDINCLETNSVSDFVEIKDGKSENSLSIGKLCGNDSRAPVFLTTTQNYMLIR